MLDKFADDLKHWREEKGLPLLQVATKTKIDIKKLEALEDGDFAFLPELYIKAFLKDYAKAIGLKEQFILEKYEAAKQGKYFEPENQTTTQPIAEEKKEKKIEKHVPEPVKYEKVKKEKTNQSFDAVSSRISDINKGTKNNNFFLLLSILAGVVIIGVLIYYIFIAGGPEIMKEGDYGNDSAEMTAEEENNTNNRYEEAVPIQSTTTTSTPIQQDSLVLTIAATSNTRLRINPDSTKTEELVIPKDESRTFKADRNFTLLFYNTSAVRLNLNNKIIDYQPKQSVEKILLDSTYTYKMLKIYPKKKSNEQSGTTKN